MAASTARICLLLHFAPILAPSTDAHLDVTVCEAEPFAGVHKAGCCHLRFLGEEDAGCLVQEIRSSVRRPC